MNAYTQPREAIGHSSDTGNIAILISSDPKESLSHIDNDENVSELDWTTENNGELDVWGVLLGRSFRIRIKEEFPADGKLTQGKIYDQSKLSFVRWDGPQNWNVSDFVGYHASDYFERDGSYKGPDGYGVEPIFEEA